MSELASPSKPVEAASAWRRMFRLAVAVLHRATTNFIEDQAPQLAASISYFTLISLFPLVLLAASGMGLLLRDEALYGRVLDELVASIPVHAPLVEESIEHLVDDGVTVGLIALGATIWAGSALAASLRNALNVTFGVEQRRPLVIGKLVDFTIAPALGLLLLGSLVLTAAWRLAQGEAVSLGILEGHSFVWEIGAAVIAGVVSFLAFLFLFWLLPNSRLQLRYLWPGALLTAVGFEALKLAFAFYLASYGHFDVVYGSLGGVIALLVWIFFSANVMLFGACVSAEIPLVLQGRARYGQPGAGDKSLRQAVFLLLRGLVLGPIEQRPEPPRWAMRYTPRVRRHGEDGAP